MDRSPSQSGSSSVVSLRVLFIRENAAADLGTLLNLPRLSGIDIALTTVDSANQAIAHLSNHEFDAVLVDSSGSESNNLSQCRILSQNFPRIPLLLLADRMNPIFLAESARAGVHFVLSKSQIETFLPQFLQFAVLKGQIESQKIDFSEHASAEKALAESEYTTRQLFEKSPIGLALCRMDGTLVDVNQAYADMIGRTVEETKKLTYWQITPQKYSDQEQIQLKSLRETGRYGPYEKEYFHKDGHLVPVRLSGLIIERQGEPYILSSVEDITQRKLVEKELQISQKLEAVGRMAGGAAHDFNNLLTGILGYCEVLNKDPRFPNELRDDLSEIHHAARRGAELTQQLLAFSRRQFLHLKVLNMNQIIHGIGKMLRRLIGEDIELATQLDPLLWNIKADLSQIEQVILNLAVNSRDAMPDGGRLIVSTANVPGHPFLGDAVSLTLTDSGLGMDFETQTRIFEPFFTTKEEGKGTGLGLSMVYGIVTQCGGKIELQSEVGKGTAFRILFPREADAPVDQEPSKSVLKLERGHGTALLVEDEEMVRHLTGRVLTENGYEVIEAKNGLHALELCRNFPKAIDLMVTDVVMPKMNGRTLATHVRGLYPNIKILYISGYAEDNRILKDLMESREFLLPKPFSPEVLLSKIHEVTSRQA